MSHDKKYRLETQIIHAGSHPDPHTGSLSVPIYQTSTFVFKNAEHGRRLFAGEEEGYIYTRIGNPNHVVIEEKVALMEGAEDAVCASSGMGAISACLLTLLNAGDHMIAAKTLYGATFKLMTRDLPRMNIHTTFVDANNHEAIKKAIQPNTRALFFESPANPTLDIYDIQALADLGHSHNLTVIMDNTFCTPYLQRPLEFGADVVVHSATKYLNGHGDVIAGFVAGSKEFIRRVRKEGIQDLTGSTLGPFEAYLILRGLKTLPIRMDRHCANAQKVAEYLEGRDKVEHLSYPGLKSHPGYEIACRQMKYPGALITFDVRGGYDAARRMINSLELCTLAVSLGDIETLIQHPASMTHCSYSSEELKEAGIGEGQVRISVGLEDPDDLIEDLEQAFQYV